MLLFSSKWFSLIFTRVLIILSTKWYGIITPALVLWASDLLSLSLCIHKNFPKTFCTRSKLYAKWYGILSSNMSNSFNWLIISFKWYYLILLSVLIRLSINSSGTDMPLQTDWLPDLFSFFSCMQTNFPSLFSTALTV